MIESLRQIKPWVRMFSILGFLGSALLVLVALVAVAGGALGAAFGKQTGLGAVGGVFLGLVYLLLALVYVFPSLSLFRFASAIASMIEKDTVRGMESALDAQKSFWRLAGILTVIVLCIYAVVLAVVVVGAIIAATR